MNKDLIDQAIKCLEINYVQLRESSVTMSDDFEPIAPGYESLEAQFRQGALGSNIVTKKDVDGTDIEILVVRYECAFRLLPPNMTKDAGDAPPEYEKNKLAEVKATFSAYYFLTNSDVSKEALHEFTLFNAGYHVWPYWREFAQSTAERMGIPRIMVPLYKLPN